MTYLEFKINVEFTLSLVSFSSNFMVLLTDFLCFINRESTRSNLKPYMNAQQRSATLPANSSMSSK